MSRNTKPQDTRLYSVKGYVEEVLSGDTFSMRTNGSPVKKPKLGVYTIKGINTPDPKSLAGTLAKLELEKILEGKSIECEIIEQQSSNQFSVKIPKEYIAFLMSFSLNNITKK